MNLWEQAPVEDASAAPPRALWESAPLDNIPTMDNGTPAPLWASAPLDSPTAPTAPDTLTAAPAMTPTSGTLPTTNVSPALAGSSSGTLPAVSPETDNAFADLLPPPLASPVALTDPRRSDTPLFPEGSLVGAPSATPVTGFLANLTPRDVLRAMRTQGGLAGFAKFLAGNTDAEQAKRRQALGLDRDPVETELNQLAESTYQQGGYQSPDYIKVEQALTAYQKARDNPDFHWEDLMTAFKADPGAMAAEFVKLTLADPELLVTPLGWTKAAAAAGTAAKAVGAGVALTRAARVAAGAAGAAATGAAITAPISAGQQLGESGTVDPARLARETAFGAGGSAAVAGLFVGAGAVLRRLAALKNRPGVDPAVVNTEIQQALGEAEQVARQAGLDPAAVRSELTRIIETPDGAVVQPRMDVLDQLPGQPAPSPQPSPARGEGVSNVDLAERARATPRDEVSLEIAATEIGDPVDVKLSDNRTTPGVILDKQPTDSAINPFTYRVRLADGTELVNVRHDNVHPTTELIHARHALNAELYPPKGGAEVPAGGEIVPPRASAAAEIPPPAPKPDLTARMAEYERLAQQTTDPEVRATLTRQAEILRAETAGQVHPAQDDLITAIRKLGGIDTQIETDFVGRLPAIERPGNGHTLDDLAAALHERGYLQNRDVGELYNKLDRATLGEKLYSDHVDPQLIHGKELPSQQLGDQIPIRTVEPSPSPGETAGLSGIEPRKVAVQPLAASSSDKSTLYANPFLLGLRETARDIGLRPGRNLAAAAAGGVGGATTSEAEPGSAQWWLDVAAGAAAVTAGAQLLRRVNLLGKGSIVDNARARLGDWIDNLPLIGRGPEQLRDLKAKQELMKNLLDRQTAETGKQLLERFTPAERAMMADLIETRGIVKDLNVIHRQAQALDDYLTHATQRMKELGMLPADLVEGGYLHRYYAKHLGLDRLFKEAKGQSLSGSWSIARGTDDVFDRQYFSPGAKKIVDEFDQVAQDITRLERRPADLLAGDTGERLATLKARKRELSQTQLREFLGQQNGKPRSFLFTTDEVGRVDTGTPSPQGVPFTKPGVRVLADQPKPPPGSVDARAVPVAPGVADLKPTNYIWSMRGMNPKEPNKVMLHRDWTQYERKSWGEIDDAGYRYVRGMTEVSHDISLATLFKTVANKADWVSAEPKLTNGKPWVFVPDQRVGKNSPLKKYGALAGQYVRPDIWNGIRGYGRNALRGGPKIPFTGVGVGDAYLAALQKWKLYKTVYNPVTHFNNTYSNIEMLTLGGYSPADIGAGVKHLAQGEKSAMWTEARDAGLFGTDWTTSLLKPDGGGSQVLTDLAEKLRTQPEIPDAELVTSLVMDLKKWWIDSKQSVAAADGAWKSGAAIAQAMAAPVIGGVKFSLKPVKVAARAMQRAYQFEDNLFKMGVYAAERGRGSTPELAVKAANDLFFNYQDVPEAIKLVRDLPVGAPFITYNYKAVQAIAKNIAQNPERVLFLVAAYEGLNYAVLTADGLSPGQYWQTESADEATSPPWDRGRALWGARNTVHLPSPEGYKLALGRAHALGNPFMSEAGGREKLPNVPGGGSFWGSSVFGGNPLHTLLDVAVNEDWKGKEIYKPGAPADEKAQKIAAYLYQAWAPSNLATPGGYQQTRVLEGMANDVRKARQAGQDPGVIAPVVDAANRTSEALGFGQFTGLDRADNEIVTRDALLASFGVKLRPVRVEQSVDFETSRTEQEKKKAAEWYKGKAREYSEGRITDAQMQQADQAFDAALERLDTQQDRLFDAEAFLQKRIKQPPTSR